jgi:hypothetical protein
MSRILAGEYRADIVANAVSSSLATMTLDGNQQPYAYWVPS